MTTKLINLNLSVQEYLPIKALLDEFAAGNAEKEHLVVPYLAAVAALHGTVIPMDKRESTSLVYFKLEAVKRRALKVNVVVTLAIPEDADLSTME